MQFHERTILGNSFDILVGGEDRIFPHYGNGIAQWGAACWDNSINYWLHHGFVIVDGQKMYKSLDNFITICKVKISSAACIEDVFIWYSRQLINYIVEQLNVASDGFSCAYQMQSVSRKINPVIVMAVSEEMLKLIQEDRDVLMFYHFSFKRGR